jgi:hypothetical protein
MRQLTIPFLLILFGAACKKDNSNNTTVNTNYTVPTTYTFSNVSYDNQLILLAMADQVVAKVNTANSNANVTVSAQMLTDMFNNTGGNFNDSALQLNASGLRLADYFPATAKTDMLNYFDSAATGTVFPSSITPTKLYLLSTNGVFYSQVIKKTIMGMCAYQIANVYMADSVTTATDTTTRRPTIRGRSIRG